MRFLVFLVAIVSMLLPTAGKADVPAADGAQKNGVSVVLVTMDTTRADFVGCYGREGAGTAVLDRLAAAGTVYLHAVSPAPLTLPAHASLLTGLEPPEHGLRTNGSHALAATVPTLATVLSDRGYQTGAFIGSRVLDRRFGLGRGFDVYEDRMPAEIIGEYGYPERDAEAVTDVALAWLRGLPAGEPFFLWIHYYDPHAPYAPAGIEAGSTVEAAYSAEIAAVDRQIGRLLAALPGRLPDHLVAVVGDHGEALGAHGERTHGVFLYRETLEVPLILAGPGVPAGHRQGTTVAIRGLAATLLQLIGADEAAGHFGPGLAVASASDQATAVYSESQMPLAAYGWAPLQAITTDRWRFISAPKKELYDLAEDPTERFNLAESNEKVARLLERRLGELKAAMSIGDAEDAELDHETAEALRALGYVAGTLRAGDGIDPKDGVAILAAMEQARTVLNRGESRRAIEILGPLIEKNPSNIPLLTRLAQAQLEAGQVKSALNTYTRAVDLDPGSEFLRLNLAHALRRSGRVEEARGAYEAVLSIDSRNLPAWLNLADLGRLTGGPEGEAAILRRALASKPSSMTVVTRLARLELDAGRAAQADVILGDAAGFAGRRPEMWLLWSEVALDQGRVELASDRCRAAADVAPAGPEAALCLAQVYLAQEKISVARAHLRRAVALGKDSPAGVKAAELLAGTQGSR